MSHMKSSFRIHLILLSGFICLTLGYCSAGMGTKDAANTQKIKEPNEVNQPSPVKIVNDNTPPVEKVKIVEDTNSSSGLNQAPTVEPNQQPDNKTADVNDKETQKTVHSSGDTFNQIFEPIFSDYVNKQG